ncbi:transcriptional adapter 3 isoform X2 [Hyalella azteca]|uniref:Transcriptional adapter 3 isoform X2 n=1 Tax=Hyalella azteca TaxID=294128 RepID=A0A8B7NAH1_HYAAZ|nr:transcriptional adapter 3 isoform X2 [Hyalella azteca]
MAPTPSKGKVHKSSGKIMRKKEHDSSRLSSGNGSHNGSGAGGSGSSSSNNKKEDSGSNSSSCVDLKDCALTLPIMAAVDHIKFLPRYTNLCSGETISMEELDNLQLELELLASSMLVRQSALTEQVTIIEQMEKGKIVPRPQVSPGKRVRTDGDTLQRPSKKAREASKARDSTPGLAPAPVAHATPPPPPSKVPKVKCSIVRNEPLFDVPDLPAAEVPRPPPSRNDITNRFWAMVDTYCQELTADDIKALEDLIAAHNDDPDVYKIQALGKHYTLRWAQEDLVDEQKESSSKLNENSSSKKKSSSNGDVPDKLLREVDLNHSSSADDAATLGPIAQRLLAGLVDERGPCENSENKVGLGVGRPGFLRSLGLGNGAGLEKRLRKELQEHGIMDADHINQDEDDEILQELKRCQSELRAVSAHNRTQLNRLLKLARDALYRHDLKKKLRDAEAKVIEAHKNLASMRVKKKPPSKRDKEAAWKAIKEREVIVRQLDTLST